ncbi:MAG: Sulfite oxidase-like protein [Propionibacteriaceae bacterium]|jgi:DMSO/TMAO reductase YedYZ molybdopterin-dependent catalytic subunit|nr:Sulfite oxidase-like protein [Propionibacteriaceae bacterium]
MEAPVPDLAAPTQPGAGWRASAGMVAALAAVGVGHGVGVLVHPVSSPLIAVGSTLIDAAPTPAKEFAVRTFGTNDKPILIGSIGAVLLVFAAVLGLIAWRHRALSLVGISLLGVAGLVAAVSRGTAIDGIPSLAAGVVGIAVLSVLTADRSRREPTKALPDRRRFLVGLGGAAALAAIGGVGGILLDRSRQAASAARRALGLPVPASKAPPLPAGAQVDGMTPFMTSIEEFYRVDISLVTPRIDTEGWALTIDGMVDRPLTLTYDELLRLPLMERTITLTCVSNEVGGPYVGNATWIGVPFSEIIKRVGVQAGVQQVFSYSLDSDYTCSTPYQAVSDGRDAMIVVGMNGQVLPDKNGFPARMLVPGLFGFVSATKWLKRIEFTTYAARSAYWTDRRWATDAPILTQSRIEVPKSLATLPKAKPVIAGVAWAQHRGIEKVEIRIDGGEWAETKLAADAGVDMWRQWTYRYDGPPGLHSAQVRATDQTGETQPEARTRVFPSGARGWHEIQFTAE